METNRFNEAWLGSCQSHLASNPRDSTETDWEVCHTIFWGNFRRFVLFYRKSTRGSSNFCYIFPQKEVTCLTKGESYLCDSALQNYAFEWKHWNISMSYFPPNTPVFLHIEYSWLRLLEKVPGLWKMQTIGKTVWKTQRSYYTSQWLFHIRKHKQRIL